LFTVESFEWHLENVQGDEAHVAALWSLLGAEVRALERGRKLL